MNDTTLAELERLAQLKAEGILSDAEYEAAKRLLLAVETKSPDRTLAKSALSANPPRLSKTWQFRFDFMSEHGLPYSATFTTAARHLGFWRRASLANSMLAFFLGPIYFFVLGLWKPATTVLIISLTYAVISQAAGFPESIDRAVAMGFAAFLAASCVPIYFLKVTKGIHSWNPFIWAGSAWR